MRYLPAPQGYQRSAILGMLGAEPAEKDDLPESLQAEINGIIAAASDNGADVTVCKPIVHDAALAGFRCGWRRGALTGGVVMLLVGGVAGYMLAQRVAKKAK